MSCKIIYIYIVYVVEITFKFYFAVYDCSKLSSKELFNETNFLKRKTRLNKMGGQVEAVFFH